ncbi:uncharacterized protein LOC115529687 [Gadus morhua]|uniref:uncharacterized protein LOC115529687 n=1 Tax=Gadus morhua TaxID=8049 RepID=UPI0011B4E76F|nr:uncharacterized protein LOC115529687 [Gadus morhua]XP_030194486.1 uncharacterized protein LOC115529687 [Gadus morhua]XP_030194487.1 uncharacterized protein LOC115529687 [Gadus morhua]
MQQQGTDVCPSQTSGCEAAPCSPVQRKQNSGNAVNVSQASLREKAPVQDAGDMSPSQKERWFQTMKLNQVLPQFTASGHIADGTSAFDNDSVKCQSSGGPLGGSITSPQSRSSETTLDISAPSVPPNRVTLHPSGTTEACQLQSKMSTKGSSSTATPHPGVPRPAVPSPKAQQKPQVGCNQPKPLNVEVTAGLKTASSTHLASLKAGRSGAANDASQVGLKTSALVTGGSDDSVDKTRVTPVSEEERVAKRREQWRIKKREQRAKLAARSTKSRERTQFTGTTLPRPVTQKAGVSHGGGLKHPPPLSSVQSMCPKQSVSSPRPREAPANRLLQNARVTLDSSSVPRLVKKEEKTDEESGPARLNPVGPSPNQNTLLIKVENPQVSRKAQPAFTPNVKVERRIDYPRKFSNHAYFSNVNRAIARCRTPRQRLVETQKCFSNQRNLRVKFPSLAAIYNSRNVPKILPNESPEQTASRRREYWRIKKREQRAKQSLEVKAQLKEKDSLMRRVKRYQKILEEMRRARAQTVALGGRSTGGMLTHASETIGGFIKEDGTVTVSLPPVPTDTAAAAGHEAEQTSCLLSDDGVVAHSPHPSHAGPLGHGRDAALGYSGRLGHRPPPPLRPAQVRVTLPRDGQSANKPPRLLSIRPRTHFQRSAAAHSNRSAGHNAAQITLTHPPFPRAAGSEVSATGVSGGGGGGCVMKMAVSSLLAPPCEDAGLTEEQRMAKKREYWRVKKREQRAARATKLKHGLLPAWDAAMQRRKTHKQTPLQRSAMTANTATQIRNSAKQKMNVLPSCNVNVPNPQQAKQIKVEREPVPASDLNIRPERAICPIKQAPSPSPPLALPQPEPDPTLSAETQATTLLAVASMKKLLEESLSTVTECQPAAIKTEPPPPCKAEREEDVSDEHLVQEMKSEIPEASLGGEEDDDKLPLAANLTLQIKSWQADPDDSGHACPRDPYPYASTQTGESSTPLSSTTPDPQCPTALGEGGPTQTLSPLRRAKRLCTKKSGNHLQHCCSSEPPRLHHSPATPPPPPQRVQPAAPPSRCLLQPRPSAPQQPFRRPLFVEPVGGEGGMSCGNSLQEKREYWKLKKRQQRARSKARQKGGPGHRQNSRLSSQNNAQTLNPLSVNHAPSGKSPTSPPAKRCLQPKAPTATLTAVHSIPTLLVVSPTASNDGRSPDLLQVKPPVCSSTSSPGRGRREVNARPSGTSCDPDASECHKGATADGDVDVPSSDGVSDAELRLAEKPTPESRVRRWTVHENSNAAPALATLTPPDNPLSSINLFPIEPLAPTSGRHASYGSPVRPAHTQPPKPKPAHASPTKLVPLSTLAPPKPIPGESQEEFLRRKREYWRVKKKEQRARKAIRDRELSQRRAPGNWKPIRPAKDQERPQYTENQDLGDCDPAYEDSERLMSSTSDAEMGYYSYSSDTVQLEDGDPDHGFADHGCGGGLLDADHGCGGGGGGGEDLGSVSDGAWRSRYLMDHDPLNQLLVCMVCGDLLYSHSLEGVRAHIEEAHPDTLNLEPPECRRILDAWDEQVSQRERFFTSQLQQHGATLAEANGS